ncbi:MAG: ATP-dependent DNA helicase RecQ [Bdellovibrionales bacterium]|nr:ATP-dependent DNA helicase RecQ [Bdellovibrionales bacterium]
MIHRLKPAQHEVLRRFRLGQNVFALLPTGYGKSLCYQWPALRWGWRVVVVSPLVALMEDQVRGLAPSKALRLHSGMTSREECETLERVDRDDWRILFVSPERLLDWERKGFWWNRRVPDLLALDEFHCVSEWRGFRPAYRALGDAVTGMAARGACVGAFTATMPVARAQRIFQDWGLHVGVMDLPLGRENLGTWLAPCEHEAERWLSLVGLLGRVRGGRGALVYCSSRAATEDLARSLTSMGFSVGAFHAGLPADLRMARLRGFLGGHIRVMVATSAFGMGLDRSDVDLVVHWGLPWSVEGLWQEAGRAGRGNQEAHHVVLWCRSDLMRFRNETVQEPGFELVDLLLRSDCRKSALTAHFGVGPSECGGCDVCWSGHGRLPEALHPLEKIVGRTAWWLSDEAAPRDWMGNFLKNS